MRRAKSVHSVPRHCPPPSSSGHIYFVRAGKNGLVKIGWSTHVAQRIRDMQATSSSELHLLASFRGTIRDEHNLHARFAYSRRHGEWFRMTEELRQIIDDMASGRHPDSLRKLTASQERWLRKLDEAHGIS